MQNRLKNNPVLESTLYVQNNKLSHWLLSEEGMYVKDGATNYIRSEGRYVTLFHLS